MGYGDVSGCQGLAVAKPDDEALFAHRTGEWGGCLYVVCQAVVVSGWAGWGL